MPDFIWTEEKILWYQEAVAYFGYDRVLADAAEPYLPREETVCDLGCGSGYLAMELARRGYRVTAADKNGIALDYLEREAARRGITGLTIRRADWLELPPGAVWDNVVMAMAGQPAEDMALFRRFARHRLILFTKADRRSHIRPDGVAILQHASREEIEAALVGVPFETFPLTTPFGQPFRSPDEAAAYLRAYGEEDATPETAAERLSPTGAEDYPFVLPGQKSLNVFIIPGTGEGVVS